MPACDGIPCNAASKALLDQLVSNRGACAVSEDCFYGNNSFNNATDPCVVGLEVNSRADGSAPGSDGHNIGPIGCIEYDDPDVDMDAYGQSDHISFSAGAGDVYVPYLLSEVRLSIRPCQDLSACQVGSGPMLHRWITLFGPTAWYYLLCNYPVWVPGEDTDQYVMRGLRHSHSWLQQMGHGRLMTVIAYYGVHVPPFAGPYHDHYCFLNDIGEAKTEEIGAEASALDSLNIVLVPKYGDDNTKYTYSNEFNRELMNAAWAIITEYVDKLDSPGHDATQGIESPTKSTWYHSESFNGTAPPGNPLPADPVVKGTADYYTEYWGLEIPITLHGLMDTRIQLSGTLRVRGVNIACTIHVETKTGSPITYRVTGYLEMGAMVAVKLDSTAFSNPYVQLMGAPGEPLLAAYSRRANFSASPSGTVSLSIPNAPIAMNMKLQDVSPEPAEEVELSVLVRGDFGTTAKNLGVKINDVLINTISDIESEAAVCGTDTLITFYIDWEVWNTYADGATTVTVSLHPSGSVDLPSCGGGDGNLATITVRYLFANPTLGNPYDLRVKDPITGLESATERIIAKGPHGERVPMQKRDDSGDYVMFWRALHTGRTLSRGPNTFSLQCASPSGGNCCGVYKAIEQAVFFGRTDHNDNIDEAGLIKDPFPGQRYEGGCTFDIEGDGCAC